MSGRLTFREFVQPLVWLDGRPLRDVIEPYRWQLFDRAFEREADGLTFVHNLILAGRAKKNFKTADMIVACFYALLDDSPGGNQVYLVANDAGQAQDDLEIAKKFIDVNPLLASAVQVRKNDTITRRDGAGFIEVLPGQDAIGAHGKTFRLLAVDEIHGQKDWDLIEALAMDPTRSDTQTWITSYASLFHKPGAPLFDMVQRGRAGTDARMLFSWYAADFTTDPELADAAPEDRANPSRRSFTSGYLEQQRFSDLLSGIIHYFLDALLKAVEDYVAEMLIKLAVLTILSFLSGGGVAGSGGGGGDVGGPGTGEGGYADGGIVYAAVGWPQPRGTDTVPAMLTPGERVLTVQDTQAFDHLGGVPALRGGGLGGALDASAIANLHTELRGLRSDLAIFMQNQPMMLRHALRGA